MKDLILTLNQYFFNQTKLNKNVKHGNIVQKE
jgi:hypothetical protein